MRVEAIGTAIEPGDPACDRFFCPAGEVPFRKMHRVAEAHYLAQKIRAMAEALENARHLPAARVRAPLVVYLRNLTSGVRILNYVDLGLRVCHARRLAYRLELYHQALVAGLTGDSFPVKIFQERNGVFPRFPSIP